MLLLLVLPTACTSGDASMSPSTTAARDGGDGIGAVGPPAALGPLADGMIPSASPVQAGEPLRGRPVPTNQWWTSALTGPYTGNLWARPLVARATPDGLQLGATTTVVASADVISTPFEPAFTIGGPLEGVEVVGYGDFSVQLALDRTRGEPIVADLAQGTTILHLSVPAGDLELHADEGSLTSMRADGPGRLAVEVGGQMWDVAITGGATWSVDGARLTSTSTEPRLLAIGPRPAGDAPGWGTSFAAAATRPVTTTTSTVEVDWDRGVVRQVLRWERPPGPPAPIVLLPHQQDAATDDLRSAGTFRSSLGTMSVVHADSLELEYPVDGFLAAVPDIQLSEVERADLLDDLRRDIDDTAIEGGSYAGAKALGRVAMLAELARALDAHEELELLVGQLRAGLLDWCTYTSSSDRRWLAHEPAWGGITAHPSEFGHQDYNDHHFQYGYLIRAAATLVELSPADAGDLLATVDLLVADVAGGAADLPAFRGFNAYEGHSFASGFAPFADGNNQESSSEAVHAWEAIARWGLVTQRSEMTAAAIGRHTIEAATARAYWLGERPGVRAEGYAHEVAGIVWGGKVDFATWFDERASAAIGIQLLPFTFASLYRSDEGAARARVDAARQADGSALLWPDLFAMEEAIADPPAAARILERAPVIESGNSRTLLRYWILALARLGPPTAEVRATSAAGLAFRSSLVARNVGPEPIDVEFVDRDGSTVASMPVPPGSTVIRPR